VYDHQLRDSTRRCREVLYVAAFRDSRAVDCYWRGVLAVRETMWHWCQRQNEIGPRETAAGKDNGPLDQSLHPALTGTSTTGA